MSFKKLQWLFPIAVLLHNVEEAIWMPGWAERHGVHLPVPAPGAGTIRSALVVITIAAFVVTYMSSRKGEGSFWAYLLFGSIVAMLVNVFVPHLPATVILHSYTPGVATAVLINLPVMSVLAIRAVREGWVSGAKAVAFGVAIPMLAGGLILLLSFADRIV